MRLFIPSAVIFNGPKAEGAAEVDYARPGVEHGGGELHGNVCRGSQENEHKLCILNGFGSTGEALRPALIADGGRRGGLAVVEQHWLDEVMFGEEADEFRAAIPAVPDNSDFQFRHWMIIRADEYLF